MTEEIKKRYITIHEGTDFRKIAKIMTAKGWKMNHATARNQVIQAMNNLLSGIAKNLNVNMPAEKLEEMLKKQDIHDSLIDILWTAHQEILLEEQMKEHHAKTKTA